MTQAFYERRCRPYSAFSQAFSVNACRWRIRGERPGDSLGPRDSKRVTHTK